MSFGFKYVGYIYLTHGRRKHLFQGGRQKWKGENNSEYLKGLSLEKSFGSYTQALDIEQRKHWEGVKFEGIDISGSFTEDGNILGIQVKSKTIGLSVVVLVLKQVWKTVSFVDRITGRKWHKEKCKRGRNWQSIQSQRNISLNTL